MYIPTTPQQFNWPIWISQCTGPHRIGITQGWPTPLPEGSISQGCVPHPAGGLAHGFEFDMATGRFTAQHTGNPTRCPLIHTPSL